ncbi:cation diffusion facilitator family transporter [Pullulanibacillus sp. KACC 23026]|uniref:cation diffusion facilitator family transporter n=1 Tax=Pullulanibacillus sp. KACC 23026 TaxID=3028315 RepID=UPI0023B19A19|nr:cation diffusion facilitator family transporter [Pullulanibacillus sp. KACC 23026]WEG12804.1 cation diffusion facilitator family transporter [Pullulanibacillus sp. KACC 23026]
MAKQAPSTWLTAWIGLISNFILTALKIIVGVLFNSTALLADGIHNGGDVIASIATLGSMKVASLPADKDHPYGHGKAEDIGTVVVAIVLGFAGVYLIYESVHALFLAPHQATIWSLGAALVSLIWKQILYSYTISVGRKMRSKSLMATAYDHLADVWASLAAVVGIGVAWIGQLFSIPFTEYGDPFAGIVVSLLILKVAFEMGNKAIQVLMESSVSDEVKQGYQTIICSLPQVKRIDRLRAREHGNYILIDIRISIPGTLTIQEGHDITRYIRDTIMETYPDVEEVLIHLNPWYAEDQQPPDKSVPPSKENEGS